MKNIKKDDTTSLPKSWEIKKLGDVCEVIAGQSPEGKFYNSAGNGMPFYQGKKEYGEKYIGEPTIWTTKITKEAEAGDVLMSVRAPVGPVNFATQKICIGRGLAAIRAGKSIDKEFLFNFLVKNENEIEGNAGAVFNSISKKQIENIPIPLPPLSEQRRIVSILDKCFSAIERSQNNAEQNLINAKEIFESYLNRVFVGSTDSKTKDKNWEEKKLGEVCTIERGSSPRPINKYQTNSPDGVNWIKIGDTKGVDKYIYTTKEKITKQGAKKSRYVKEGDFILSNSMSFGKPYIMKTDGYIHDGWFVFRLPDYLDKNYFYYLFTSHNVQEQIQSLGAGAIVKNISSDLVKKVDVFFPKSKEEQQAIVRKLDTLRTETQKLEAIYQKKIDNLDELKKSILQLAFSGQLSESQILND